MTAENNIRKFSLFVGVANSIASPVGGAAVSPTASPELVEQLQRYVESGEGLEHQGYGAYGSETSFLVFLGKSPDTLWQEWACHAGSVLAKVESRHTRKKTGPVKKLRILCKLPSGQEENHFELSFWTAISAIVRERDIRFLPIDTLRQIVDIRVARLPTEIGLPQLPTKKPKKGTCERFYADKMLQNHGVDIYKLPKREVKTIWEDGWPVVMEIQKLRDIQLLESAMKYVRLRSAGGRRPYFDEIETLFEDLKSLVDLNKLKTGRVPLTEDDTLTFFESSIKQVSEFWDRRIAAIKNQETLPCFANLKTDFESLEVDKKRCWMKNDDAEEQMLKKDVNDGNATLQLTFLIGDPIGAVEAKGLAFGLPESWGKEPKSVLMKLRSLMAERFSWKESEIHE